MADVWPEGACDRKLAWLIKNFQVRFARQTFSPLNTKISYQVKTIHQAVEMFWKVQVDSQLLALLNGYIPVFLKPPMILIGVKALTQASATSEDNLSAVTTQLGLEAR